MTPTARPRAVSLVCPTCGTDVPISTVASWRCPRATPQDRHHVLQIVERGTRPALAPPGDDDPFVAFRERLAWDAFAAAIGLDVDERVALVRETGRRVELVAGTGFRRTPWSRSPGLSDALGFSERGGVWVKDETEGVAGSHKARHLMTILLHLLAAEARGLAPWSGSVRPVLAIASCGNAALAAATLAAAVEWPIEVFVPPDADRQILLRLSHLGARVVTCPRRDDDPPGDPCVHRCREAIGSGAIPFTVQGPENSWCLDGGRTIAWEILAAERDARHPLDRLYVQVGGGALAGCVGAVLEADAASPPRLHAVQTVGCAPLARAWRLAGPAGPPADTPAALDASTLARRWADLMWPWETVPRSLADGILDDETYDWIPIVAAMSATGGSPVVVDEATVAEAHALTRVATSIRASATGTAGLAGVLASRSSIGPDERVGVILSGVER